MKGVVILYVLSTGTLGLKSSNVSTNNVTSHECSFDMKLN